MVCSGRDTLEAINEEYCRGDPERLHFLDGMGYCRCAHLESHDTGVNMPAFADLKVLGFRCPKKGEYYWDSEVEKIMQAFKDFNTEYLVLEEIKQPETSNK